VSPSSALFISVDPPVCSEIVISDNTRPLMFPKMFNALPVDGKVEFHVTERKYVRAIISALLRHPIASYSFVYETDVERVLKAARLKSVDDKERINIIAEIEGDDPRFPVQASFSDIVHLEVGAYF